MGDTAKPVAAFEADQTTASHVAAPPPAAERAASRRRGDVTGRGSSETTTLVCAVALAVALGVACGTWINARLASAASIAQTAPSHLLPEAPRVAVQTAHESSPGVAETRPGDSQETALAAVEDTHAHDSGERPDEQRATPKASVVKAESRPTVVAATPRVREAASSEKASGERAVVEGERAPHRAVRRQGSGAPCALYASAGSLNIRGGGAATLVVGGPGEPGRVSLTTPDWADIAVFSEGRAGGKGWVRYSVRSVGKRAGVYTVRLATPCGSQNIPVTVTRP